MEISPVTGIRLMPTPKTPPKESGIAAIFDLEATARSGEDNYSNEKKKAAGAEESDEEDLDAESATERSYVPTEDGLVRNINYFA